VRVYYSEGVAFNLLNAVVSGLGQELTRRKLSSVPKRLSRSFSCPFVGSTAKGGAEHEGSCLNKLLCNLGLTQIFAGKGKISDIQGQSLTLVNVAKDLDHLVAVFVDANNGEVNVLGGKVFHQILDHKALRRAIWVVVDVTLVNVFAVTRCITN
jgi:hypothetical protein